MSSTHDNINKHVQRPNFDPSHDVTFNIVQDLSVNSATVTTTMRLDALSYYCGMSSGQAQVKSLHTSQRTKSINENPDLIQKQQKPAKPAAKPRQTARRASA